MRISSLEGLRGFAVLLVLIYHSFMPYTRGGFFGVDIFFVLSGFLITKLLLKEYESNNGLISFRKFYIRRFLRLAPALTLLVLCFYIYSQTYMTGRASDTGLYTSLGALFYIANLAIAHDWFTMGYLTPVWSLSIEEQFYFIWPAILVFLLAQFKISKKLILVNILLIIFLWSYRALLTINNAPIDRLYFGSDTHMDGLLVGSLLAVLVTIHEKAPHKVFNLIHKYRASIQVILFLFFILTTIALDINIRSLYIWCFPLVEVLSAILIFSLYSSKDSKHSLFSNRFLVWIGRISYGLYLWHWFVFKVISEHNVTGIYVLLYGVPLSVLIAFISYYVLEKPILKIKVKYQNSKL